MNGWSQEDENIDNQQGPGDAIPLQYSCLENPMDEGARWAAVHGVAKSWTFPFSCICQ